MAPTSRANLFQPDQLFEEASGNAGRIGAGPTLALPSRSQSSRAPGTPAPTTRRRVPPPRGRHTPLQSLSSPCPPARAASRNWPEVGCHFLLAQHVFLREDFPVDARTGRQIWSYTRPRTPAGTIAGDAALGANRGVAALGDRIFFITDNAHLICLHRLTGAILWDVYMPEEPQHYGGTSAPLVVGDLVIGGVAGADNGIRGFIAAYKAGTGELAWRFWTIPRRGEPGF